MPETVKPGSLRGRVTEQVEVLRRLVQADGGDIELIDVKEETGVVSIRFQGACRGCPGAAMTLKMGIERNLREKIPEIKEVIAV
jgi:Fe-S cluster biogenesis protein NfuA